MNFNHVQILNSTLYSFYFIIISVVGGNMWDDHNRGLFESTKIEITYMFP